MRNVNPNLIANRNPNWSQNYAVAELTDLVTSLAIENQSVCRQQLDGCIVLNEHNTVLASKRSAICNMIKLNQNFSQQLRRQRCFIISVLFQRPHNK